MLIAINRNLIDKATEADLKANNGTFENVDISATELAAHVDQGFAFCAQHKGKWRTGKNFTASGYLAVDVDYGLTLEAVQADDFYKQYASILYTTPSHTPESHRFRVIFELEQPITDPVEMQQAMTGVIVRFGSDKNCKDPCRLFFGSKGSTPIIVGKLLPTAEVELLKVRGEESLVRTDSVADDRPNGRSAVHSRTSIPTTTAVRTINDTVESLKDIPLKTRVYCPFHIDTRPSAFVLKSENGNPGIFCSTCCTTFFLDDGFGSKSTDKYKFDYRWSRLLNVTVDEWTAYANEDGNVDLSELRGVDIKELNERYLRYKPTFAEALELPKTKAKHIPPDPEIFPINDGAEIVLVKSPKGTGKTEWLKKLVAQKMAAKQTVLLIGHRRALIAATASRIGLASYLQIREDGSSVPFFFHRVPLFAVCVDSLPSLDLRIDKYDVVLIDEVEQVLSHLLSSTLKENRRSALLRLQWYLKNAKSMYLLDADLHRVTVDILDEMLDERPRTCQIIINTWQATGKTLYLYDSPKPNHLIGELSESLKRGERCFVCSNSKKLLEELESEVRNRLSRPIKTLLISSDNSQSPEIQKFIAEIKTRVLDYDVIFASPALGTGIDITFDDDAQLINTVFGFFRARINTHFDIDQQLSRVRNPKRINVWISPETFQFETDSEAIQAELMASEDEHRRLLGIAPDGTDIFDENTLYDKVFSTVTANERASKNNLRKHFVDLRRSNGWTVEEVSNDKILGQVGKEIAQAGKDAQRIVRFERILAARQLDTEDYDHYRRLSKADQLGERGELEMRRYEIEAFYRCDADLVLLEADDEGRLRDAIRRYELIMTDNEVLKGWDTYDANLLRPDKPQNVLKKTTIKALFEAAGIMRKGVFDTSVEIDASKLGKFIAEVRKNKQSIERLFGISVRKDINRSPVRQLQEILKWLGLTLPQSRRDQSGKKARVLYRLNEDGLQKLIHWARIRADEELHSSWLKQREHEIVDPSTVFRVGKAAEDPIEAFVRAKREGAHS